MDDAGIADRAAIRADEYWAKKGAVDLYMYRKRRADADGAPVVFLVHGSSFSARTSYDLTVPGGEDYSVMNLLAAAGYDVWTMDHEGYGRSSRTEGNSDFACNLADLEAGTAVVAGETGRTAFTFFGQSSGALRAGILANAHPERVERLILAAFTWTGKDAPTLIKRRERLDEWTRSNRRVVDEAYYFSVFNRDVSGLTAPDLPAAAAKAEMANGGGSVPNGSYYEMCVNLPVVDPARIACPVLIIRGDHDGIATDEDVAAFFRALPNADKQLVLISGQSHNTQFGINRRRFHHAVLSYLAMPPRVDVR